MIKWAQRLKIRIDRGEHLPEYDENCDNGDACERAAENGDFKLLKWLVEVQAVSTMKDLALPSDSPIVAGVRCARSQCRCRVQTPIAVTGGCFK